MTVRLRIAGLLGFGIITAAMGALAVAQDYGRRDYPDNRGYDSQRGYDQRGFDPQASQQQPPVYSQREIRCRSLEQQLAGDWMRGQGGQDALPRLDADIREQERVFQRAEYDAERANCFEDMFIFGRSLRRTPRCLQLNDQIESARRRLAALRQQREGITNTDRRRERQDDLVAELARNGCGESYQRQAEARRRDNSFFGLWEDSDSGGGSSAAYQPQDVPFGTYRTMCVRLCDGYYFPVSYSTLQSKFREDEAKCTQQCAAPAQLFVYRNPGEEVEQMVSVDGRPYRDIPNAFRNRREYVKGCSCNASEYSEAEIAKAEQTLRSDADAARTASARPKTDPRGMVPGQGGGQPPAPQQAPAAAQPGVPPPAGPPPALPPG